MTLEELIQDAQRVGNLFTSAWIPLKLKGKDVKIKFEPIPTDSTIGWVINLKIEKK